MITLRPYQREAVEKLDNGKILCGNVGSGKSLTALVYYFEKECLGKLSKDDYKPMQKDIPLYIITTARKRDSLEWQRECANIALDISKVIVDSWNNIEKYKNIKNLLSIKDRRRKSKPSPS